LFKDIDRRDLPDRRRRNPAARPGVPTGAIVEVRMNAKAQWRMLLNAAAAVIRSTTLVRSKARLGH